MFNNLLGGIFFALMDAYGLELVSVQIWGVLWGILSPAYIIGGLVIARKGLGKNPLRILFLANIAIWSNAIFFAIQPSIILLSIGIAVWLSFFPVIQATEQTIIQKVVSRNHQGRVFGFSRSLEQSITPLVAFIIGPIAQFIFIPFMTTGAGVQLIGSWFGTGTGRGIALVFILAGIIGLVVTVFAMRSKIYKRLTKRYLE
jgi:MFS transporter, DHA3 family, multidrug efflux protein